MKITQGKRLNIYVHALVRCGMERRHHWVPSFSGMHEIGTNRYYKKPLHIADARAFG